MDAGKDLCKYDPGRGVDYYAGALAGILGSIVGHGQDRSTHAYVKEVRKALETLVFMVWDRYEEYIPVTAESNVPDRITSKKGRECFANLLVGLLRRFRETTRDLPIGARIRLMNMTLAAIAEMARYNKIPPVGREVASYIFSKQGPEQGPTSESEMGGESP